MKMVLWIDRNVKTRRVEVKELLGSPFNSVGDGCEVGFDSSGLDCRFRVF